MKDSVRRCKETFLRVQAFGRENAAGADQTSFVGRHLATIDSVLTELEAAASEQAAGRSAARQATLAKNAALAQLMRGLEAISRTSRPIAAKDPSLPLQQFRVPRRQSVQGVLAVAVSVAKDARRRKAEFVLRGLPENFVELLEEDMEALRNAVARSIEARRAHVTATAYINELVALGLKALRELDPYMRNTHADSTDKINAWRSAARVERRAPRPRADEQTAPPNSPTPNAPPAS